MKMPMEQPCETNRLRVGPAPLDNAGLLVLLVEDFLDEMLYHSDGDVSQIESSKVKFWKVICNRLHGSFDEDLLRIKQKLHLALEVDAQEKTFRMWRSLDNLANRVVLYSSDTKELVSEEMIIEPPLKSLKAPKESDFRHDKEGMKQAHGEIGASPSVSVRQEQDVESPMAANANKSSAFGLYRESSFYESDDSEVTDSSKPSGTLLPSKPATSPESCEWLEEHEFDDSFIVEDLMKSLTLQEKLSEHVPKAMPLETTAAHKIYGSAEKQNNVDSPKSPLSQKHEQKVTGYTKPNYSDLTKLLKTSKTNDAFDSHINDRSLKSASCEEQEKENMVHQKVITYTDLNRSNSSKARTVYKPDGPVEYHKNKHAPRPLSSLIKQEEEYTKQVIGIDKNVSLKLSKVLAAVKTNPLTPEKLAEWRETKYFEAPVERYHEDRIDLGLLADPDVSKETKIPTYHWDEHGNKILTVTVFCFEYLPNSNIITFKSIAVLRDRVKGKMDVRPMEEKLPEIAKKFPQIMQQKQK